uniref:PUM-HD domain-containing protein n=1 Tax=Panagrellus redivivus TaxID=6233 RepID=A0A7E4VGN3_PANRE
MSMDQSANHVLQKIIDHVPADKCQFIVDEMCSGSSMDQIICNKFGCRVVQFCVEKLAPFAKSNGNDGNLSIETKLIRKMLEKISRKAYTYCQDEFANYIIQYIIKTRCLSFYKDRIISKSLRGNIVALSQAKYSSHVMEQAFEFANYDALLQLVEEVFNGLVNTN